jgi:hypothetical protein
MRTVDPDQEQPYYGNFVTRNYVQYQPYAADGSDCCLGRSYVNPSNPNTALVVAVGVNNFDFFCGLGTIIGAFLSQALLLPMQMPLEIDYGHLMEGMT